MNNCQNNRPIITLFHDCKYSHYQYGSPYWLRFCEMFCKISKRDLTMAFLNKNLKGDNSPYPLWFWIKIFVIAANINSNLFCLIHFWQIMPTKLLYQQFLFASLCIRRKKSRYSNFSFSYQHAFYDSWQINSNFRHQDMACFFCPCVRFV